MKISKIFDSVHRFIHIDPIESELIKSRPFQRLHYIHQLGVTFFVYPGGTHRRFEHSLGVMELATRIYDQITSEESETLPEKGTFSYLYWRKVLRLAALCHDLGHLPFSHTAEHYLIGDGGHEKWTRIIIQSEYLVPIWESVAEEAARAGESCNPMEDVIKLSLGEKKYRTFSPEAPPFTPLERIISEIITGDFFGSDRIDYLLRDSKSTGLAYGLFDYHQLIEMLKVIPALNEVGELALGVEENGIESCEALLLARHYMHKRLYQYSSVKSYSFHMARFMAKLYQGIDASIESYLSMTDNEVLADLNRASRDPDHIAHFDASCLYLRNHRFRALALPERVGVEELSQIQESLGIPEGEMAWELTPKKGKRLGLSFPVLRHDGSVVPGDELSEISIPANHRNWLYLAPAHEESVREKIDFYLGDGVQSAHDSR